MFGVIGLDAFLDQHPFMSLVPQGKTEDTLLEGKLRFHWTHDDQYEVKGFYELKITIPAAYPTTLPLVEEIGGQIPRNGDFHINEDGSFCLGSTLRLQLALRESADFNVFSEKFLIPFLYAVSVKQQQDEEANKVAQQILNAPQATPQSDVHIVAPVSNVVNQSKMVQPTVTTDATVDDDSDPLPF